MKRGYAALQRMETQLRTTRFLIGERVSLADLARVAYTRVAHEGGFELAGYGAVRRWIRASEQVLGIGA